MPRKRGKGRANAHIFIELNQLSIDKIVVSQIRPANTKPYAKSVFKKRKR